MKVLIDCDPGIDDAIALGMVLSRQDIEIVGITCVRGNVEVEKCVTNVLKILEVFDRKDIPVFKGAEKAIIDQPYNAKNFHGEDGLADVLKYEPDRTPYQEEHAVTAMCRLAKLHKGEITIIAIAPLTNLALALRMEPSFPDNIKEVIIMGGNYKGVGNITMAAEFNFYVDPVAAHITLEEFKCPIYLITWELSMQTFLNVEDVSKYCSGDTKKCKFMREVLGVRGLIESHTCGFCDSVAVVVAINREIVLKEHRVYGTVETGGLHTKGMLVLDWNPEHRVIGGDKEPNLIIIDQIDGDLYRRLFLDSVK